MWGSKFLVIGDCHSRPKDLDECYNFMRFVENKAKEYKVDKILFLGDQCDTHNLVYNSVLKFWKESILLLSKIAEVILMVGNHDFERGLTAHSMEWFKGMNNVTIVDEPIVYGNKLFLPFIENNTKFVDICKQFSDCQTVFCHSEFKGGKFDNGFYIPNGINPEDIPQSLIVSGHIHAAQRFGKVFYVGSPRWLNLGDANVDKFIYVTDFNNELIRISTKDVCKPIYKFDDIQGNAVSNIKLRGDVTVDIHGDEQYIIQQSKLYQEMGYKVRTFVIKNKEIVVKESIGVLNAFNNFLFDYKPPYDTSIERLKEMSTQRILWTK